MTGVFPTNAACISRLLHSLRLLFLLGLLLKQVLALHIYLQPRPVFFLHYLLL